MALLLVLNFLGKSAGLLLLDFLSGFTDLHSIQIFGFLPAQKFSACKTAVLAFDDVQLA